jgi:hypothetical protein
MEWVFVGAILVVLGIVIYLILKGTYKKGKKGG